MTAKKKLVLSLVFGVVLGGLCAGGSLLISNSNGMRFSDVQFYLSLLLVFVGAFSMMKGNPTINFAPMGSKGSNMQADIHSNAQVAMNEYKSTNVPKNFLQNHVLAFNAFGLAVLLAGLINLVWAIIPFIFK